MKAKRLNLKELKAVPNVNYKPEYCIKILSLDVASVTGWAVSRLEYGTWDFKTRKDESMGMKLIRLRSKLDEVKQLTNFHLIVYERPAGRFKNAIIHEAKMLGLIEE